MLGTPEISNDADEDRSKLRFLSLLRRTNELRSKSIMKAGMASHTRKLLHFQRSPDTLGNKDDEIYLIGFLVGYLEGEAGYKIYFPTMRVVQHVMHAFLKEDIVYGDPYSDGYDTLLSEWLSKQSDSCSDDDNEKESIHMEDEEDESIISQEESMHSQDEVMLSGNELEDESIPK
ncbi:unnamed protein product [Peronospora belbahrii]|uniref:Uncharacterized protein n=1 Tax=Peronospora belbahrii TaxID=622444 RepID=A0AAU9L5V6_9STRA|nr:unnamed protein product [Peronospora belbahrii]